MENCEVDNAASSYFGCDGVKVSFRSNQFAIISKGRSDADGGIQYFLKVYNNRTSTADFIGRIIRLTIRCDNGQAKPLNRQYTRYLLFKYVGNVTCPVSLSSQGPLGTRALHSHSLPSTMRHITTATKSIKTDSMLSLPTFTVTTVPREIMSTSTVTTQSTMVGAPATVSGALSTVSATPSSTFVIQTTVVPSLPNTPASEASVVSSPQINRAYQSDDQDLYRELSFQEAPIYASYQRQDIQPRSANTKEDHYAQLNIPEDQHIYGLGGTEESTYNVLGEHVSDRGVIYENYEFSEEEEADTVYNVLEDPSGDRSEGSDPDGAICEDGPVYKNVSRQSSQVCNTRSHKDSELTNGLVYNNTKETLYHNDTADDDFVTKDYVRSILRTLSRIEQ
ncbi:uncharacterized protein [Porites lutea]|uniref:uncharacterized protein isoform X2 n=1 Tax=Porites lutea TaxID=51062 RepID=UPI003CC61DD1